MIKPYKPMYGVMVGNNIMYAIYDSEEESIRAAEGFLMLGKGPCTVVKFLTHLELTQAKPEVVKWDYPTEPLPED